jgi:hypothetical protein
MHQTVKQTFIGRHWRMKVMLSIPPLLFGKDSDGGSHCSRMEFNVVVELKPLRYLPQGAHGERRKSSVTVSVDRLSFHANPYFANWKCHM